MADYDLQTVFDLQVNASCEFVQILHEQLYILTNVTVPATRSHAWSITHVQLKLNQVP